jgi:hypothetical protein
MLRLIALPFETFQRRALPRMAGVNLFKEVTAWICAKLVRRSGMWRFDVVRESPAFTSLLPVSISRSGETSGRCGDSGPGQHAAGPKFFELAVMLVQFFYSCFTCCQLSEHGRGLVSTSGRADDLTKLLRVYVFVSSRGFNDHIPPTK